MSRRRTKSDPVPDRRERVIRSAIWAAWADSLGFISELTDERGLRRRLGKNGARLDTPVRWSRRVGGRYGVEVDLPAGCYSDDTQLRLAVGRAVTGAGFDVEAFARVELAVWPSYALGGGNASKAAASNIAKANVAWFANFYKGWTKAGGNGAAMRIQPHVWAARDPAGQGAHLRDVLIDAITTHGHPRALFGAVLHATALGETLETGNVPGPDKWQDLLAITIAAPDLLRGHLQFDELWRPSWESQVGQPFSDAWAETSRECEELLKLAAEAFGFDSHSNSEGADNSQLAEKYASLISFLHLDDVNIRGSGLHTVVAALALSAATGARVRNAAVVAARAVGTDTDTIATMAAAVSGAADGAENAPEVLDGDYITSEARRLSSISAGEPTERFAYPDLLAWVPPRTQSDACGLADGRRALSGLAWCEPIGSNEFADARGSLWRWMRTDFGQTVLVKHRSELRPLPLGAWPARRVVVDVAQERDATSEDVSLQSDSNASDRAERVPRGGRQGQLGFDDTDAMSAEAPSRPDTVALPEQLTSEQEEHTRREVANVDEMLEWVARMDYSAKALGYALRRLAKLGTVEQAVAFAVAIHSAAQIPVSNTWEIIDAGNAITILRNPSSAPRYNVVVRSLVIRNQDHETSFPVIYGGAEKTLDTFSAWGVDRRFEILWHDRKDGSDDPKNWSTLIF